MNNQTFHLDPHNIPQHVAIIMDGNGRWAKKRGLPRIAGHKQGMEQIKAVASEAGKLGVKVLTLYAFSTENWKRPASEVKYIMSLPQKFFHEFIPQLIHDNVQVHVMGYLKRVPKSTQLAIKKAVADTRNCNGMVLNFAVNYGGRDEILSATKEIAQEYHDGKISLPDINDQLFGKHLMTGFLGKHADPDLMIRTSGEERISNFLLWQLAYSEFVFTKTYWPDFNGMNLKQAIYEYQQRHRRFGAIK